MVDGYGARSPFYREKKFSRAGLEGKGFGYTGRLFTSGVSSSLVETCVGRSLGLSCGFAASVITDFC